MEFGHLLTRSGLTYPEVSSKISHDSFCQLENSVSLPWVIYYEAFSLHVVSSFSCIPVICLKLMLFLIPLQFVIIIIIIIRSIHHLEFIIIYLSSGWATCWPAPVSRIQKSLQKSALIPSASWGNSVSLRWVIYYEAFYLHVVSCLSCIPVICPKLVLFLIPLQFVWVHSL